MANTEHLSILLKGVRAWNKWRMANSGISPDLSRAKLAGASLIEVNFENAELSGADLGGCNLVGANLNGADLRGVELAGANLTSASLNDAILTGAALIGTNFTGTSLKRADLSGAQVGHTVFGNLDLSSAKGLDTVEHLAPSVIGIDAVYRSAGRIPANFLRGAGVPELFITYMRSLVGEAIDFYSCFFSYSSHDSAFVERLHSDLQARGVRAWYAPEDLRIGDRFSERIDEAIRLHDKVIVVLSQYSVNSPWMTREVDTATEREDRERRIVLIPITLDDAIFQGEAAWASQLRSRHIGDFRRWKEESFYMKSLDGLLRALRSDAPTRSSAAV